MRIETGDDDAGRGRELERWPDVRDGLTRVERVVLWQLAVTAEELGRPLVPTAMLYGRVLEHVDLSVDELQAVLIRFGAAVPGGGMAGRSDA